MIKVQDIAYTEYSVPDLDKQEAFLTDFGMVKVERSDDRLYMRGRGKYPYINVTHKGDPGFRAVAFVAASGDDLDKIAGHADAISGVEDIDGPGGGKRVRLKSPDGFEIHVVHGIQDADELPIRDPLSINYARTKNRQGTFQRPDLVPCEILRLGHCVFKVADAQAMAQWLDDTLGMKKTDRLYIPDNEDQTLGIFMHVDRGDDYSDHHSMFIINAPDDIKIHHTSYETQDPDAVFIGGEAMQKGGWNHEWGIGRHVLGSQVFDYWRDPWGHMFEHYADGDLVNQHHKPGDFPAIPENLAQWGPTVTDTFFD
jgi:catechol 2,3-dioxygenase-like lactoylglutathione lyase family enzyme